MLLQMQIKCLVLCWNYYFLNNSLGFLGGGFNNFCIIIIVILLSVFKINFRNECISVRFLKLFKRNVIY